jgi:hypothetical protein
VGGSVLFLCKGREVERWLVVRAEGLWCGAADQRPPSLLLLLLQAMHHTSTRHRALAQALASTKCEGGGEAEEEDKGAMDEAGQGDKELSGWDPTSKEWSRVG